MIDSWRHLFTAPYLTGIILVVVVDFLYCLVCLREILLHKKNQNMQEIQGGHCPCSKIQGGQPTTLPPPCRAPVFLSPTSWPIKSKWVNNCLRVNIIYFLLSNGYATARKLSRAAESLLADSCRQWLSTYFTLTWNRVINFSRQFLAPNCRQLLSRG